MELDRKGRWLVPAAAVVILWRAAALVYPHPEAPDSLLRSALTVLGLWFLACGLWAFHRRYTTATGEIGKEW